METTKLTIALLEEATSYITHEMGKSEKARDIAGINKRIDLVLQGHEELDIEDKGIYRKLMYILTLAEERLEVEQKRVGQLEKRLQSYYNG